MNHHLDKPRLQLDLAPGTVLFRKGLLQDLLVPTAQWKTIGWVLNFSGKSNLSANFPTFSVLQKGLGYYRLSIGWTRRSKNIST